MNRIVGVDTARGLAVLGMFVAHLGMERHVGFFTPTGWFFVADGRPSALFALLAGIGLAFMTRRAYPDDLAGLRVQRTRIIKRSAILFVFGWFLTFLLTPVAVILPSYAFLFLLALPFLRLRPTAVFAWAGAAVLVMPQVVLLTRWVLFSSTEPRFDVPPIGELLTGYYPALSWTAYLLVGLGVGRLPMQRIKVQVALICAGISAAAVGYGAGYVLWSGLDDQNGLAASLTSVEAHSGTTFEMAGNIGVGLVVLGLCLLVTTQVKALRVLLTPISATGAMSLTVYSLHIVYIRILGDEAVWYPQSNWPLIALIVGTFVFATLWQLTLGRGPLERLINRMIRPRQPQAPQQWPPAGPGGPAWSGAPTGPGGPGVQPAYVPVPAGGPYGPPGQGGPPAAGPYGQAPQHQAPQHGAPPPPGHPAHPQYGQPALPQTGHPAHPQNGQPALPQTGHPAHPQYGQPYQPAPAAPAGPTRPAPSGQQPVPGPPPVPPYPPAPPPR
ncbi:heparan-alpha-glucosaminide N-acetyltransferase domain-containing protein [Occultella gossypii]|uniref:DUF1624 domain-containing protein n=1 Tax=Occultella gossypii TaxID=2800820 RepID=A0ABS7SE30_9MICO|nr:heparan-alpha-glucosaminide N-acetyltransferase domain-containing protein [Occultella gossypii]MBZ2198615.1 DUF1624 domain-containing protein [Occultella gossypii]